MANVMAISMLTGDFQKMNGVRESRSLSASTHASERELEDWSATDLHPSQSARMLEAQRLVLEADAVFFDVDSTVVKTEGIDLLGKCFGVMQEISALTHAAMNGSMTFEDAMAQRLELMADNGMTQKALAECVKKEVQAFTDGIQEVVKRFKARGVDVYLVSGGFFNMIAPIAEILGIPHDMVYANTILFDDKGSYTGFDRTAPTSRSGGKPAVLQKVQNEKEYKTMIMFGDGVTDMDARTQGPAAAFVGYGGVTARQAVKENADWFIYNFEEILAILPEETW